MEDRTQSGDSDLGIDCNEGILCGYQVQGEERALRNTPTGGYKMVNEKGSQPETWKENQV